MTVVTDLVAAHSISFDGDGYTTQRIYLVDGVGGLPESRLYNAMTTAGIPQYGEAHPILPDVIVTKVDAKPEGSGGQVRVTVSYSLPDPATIDTSLPDDPTPKTTTLSSNVANEKVSRDINGEFMIVTWSGGVFSTKYVSADVQKPQLSVSFKRIESSIPKGIIANYLGKINSVPWSGFPAKTWLCSSIDATEDKPGIFNVDYSFTYNADDWRLQVYMNLTQEQIDELPPNVDTGNGFGIFDVYETADFNSLGMTF